VVIKGQLQHYSSKAHQGAIVALQQQGFHPQELTAIQQPKFQPQESMQDLFLSLSLPVSLSLSLLSLDWLS
jgi:hypothetical protein